VLFSKEGLERERTCQDAEQEQEFTEDINVGLIRYAGWGDKKDFPRVRKKCREEGSKYLNKTA